jgi:hypothetical protein
LVRLMLASGRQLTLDAGGCAPASATALPHSHCNGIQPLHTIFIAAARVASFRLTCDSVRPHRAAIAPQACERDMRGHPRSGRPPGGGRAGGRPCGLALPFETYKPLVT